VVFLSVGTPVYGGKKAHQTGGFSFSDAEPPPQHRNYGQLGEYYRYGLEWVDTISLYIQGRLMMS
jgi:hypothetical protein